MAVFVALARTISFRGIGADGECRAERDDLRRYRWHGFLYGHADVPRSGDGAGFPAWIGASGLVFCLGRWE